MAPRKHSRRVHYSDMIRTMSSSSGSAGASTSTSVPGTAEQPLAGQTPPHQPQTAQEPDTEEPLNSEPDPGAIHPDLMVPPSAPYAPYTVERILTEGNRSGLKLLHPDRPPGTFWFGVDCKVGRSISECIKSFFVEVTPNWKSTPPYVRITWFKIFSQRWNWDVSITETVKSEFNSKAMKRLAGIVCDWKTAWEVKGDAAKPNCMTDAVWEGLTRYWTEPNSMKKSALCSAARNTTAPDGLPLAMPHTAGQTPFGGVALHMAEETGQIPSLPELFKKTHQNKSGVFVDARSESLYKEVASAVEQRQTQLSQESTSATPTELTPAEVNSIYKQIAPRKKGRTIGVGSAQDVSRVTSAWVGDNSLRTQLADLQRSHQAMGEKFAAMESMLDILVASNPNQQAALDARRREHGLQTSAQRDAEASQQVSQEEDARTQDYIERMFQ